MVLTEEDKRRKKIYMLEWRKKNSEKIKEYKKIYNQSPAGKKVSFRHNWKQKGLNMENFDEIYERYLTTINCDNCNVLLTDGKPITMTTKCMDHDHQTGEFRNVLCNLCNIRRK